MSLITLRLFCIAPVVSLLGLGTNAPDAALKCGGLVPPDGKPVISIDGVVRPREELSTLEITKEEIDRIDIVCMDPKDSTFNRTRGWGVVSIWTKQGPAPRVAEALDVIREAQDAHFAMHGRYIAALEEIRFPDSMKPVRMTMDADEKGWIARTTLPRLLRTCAMFDGTIATPLSIGPRNSVCESHH